MALVSVASDQARPISERTTVGKVVGDDFGAPVCLVCEHASSSIPPRYGDLGLAPEHRFSHAAWDIGAADLGLGMQAGLGAPFIHATRSRLVYDLNRPPDSASAMPDRVEVIDVPGNRGLSPDERKARTDENYIPFHALVSDTLDRFSRPPALVTIHSFTPVWHGQQRAVEIGFLHDADPALAEAMLEAYAGPHRAALNQPYSARDGVTHTLAKHGTARGLQNVMIEVRNDLLTDPESVAGVVTVLSAALQAALETVA